MSVTITHPAEDVGGQSQQSVTTIERLMQVEGDSLAEIVNASVIPQPRSSHPHDARFRLVDRNFDIVGNLERKLQVSVRLTYNNDTNLKWPSQRKEEDENTPPWGLGAQNISVGYTTEAVPLKFGFDAEGGWVRLSNSAGSQLLIEGQRIIRQISFTYFVKASRAGKPPVNDHAEINLHYETIAGIPMAPYTAMLMPMNAQFLSDVDDNGNITRNYWQIDAVVLENDQTWQRSALDVGTMAIFKAGEPPQPIYQYTPWQYPDAQANLAIPPQYGSIAHVVQAKMSYADRTHSDANSYAQQFDSLPYSEITEPLPLKNGEVYTAAIKDPVNNPYGTIKYFEVAPTSWAKYNIPNTRG